MAVEWLAEHLRVSLFSNAAVQVAEEDWCAITKEKEAEARQAIAGGRVFSGRFETGLLNFSAAYNRIDIVLASPLPTEMPAEAQFASIGRWATMRDRFFEVTHSWIEHSKFPMVRIAFGAALNYPTPSRIAAYDILRQKITTVKIDPDRMHELLYRVNWPIQSNIIRDLTINRITSWSAIRIVYANFQPSAPVPATTIPQLDGVRLEIDNSTDVNRTQPFPKNQLVPILKELISHASESALKGDPQ